MDMKEEVTRLNVFGKHPGYRKKPMTHPDNVEVAPNGARDWNDDSAKGEEPFGKQIGSSTLMMKRWSISLLTWFTIMSRKFLVRT